MNGKNANKIDAVVQVIAGVFSILGIFTSIKASGYQQEQQYKDLEDRYGLTPRDTTGEQ